MTTTRRTALGLLAAVLAAGCGTGGPARHPVSGTVTFGGKPVPVGEIAFEPDAARGNDGPGSVTRVANGRYETDPGLGVVGGAYVVRITAFNGVPTGDALDGTPLLREPYVERVEFPAGTTRRDFEVPEPGRRK